MHPALRNALAVEHTFRNMSIMILPEERIVGNRSSKIVGTVIPVERGDINIDRNVDVDVDYHRGLGGDWGYQNNVGAGFAAGLYVGAVVTSIPTTCTTVVMNGVAYQSCNGVIYQPVYVGSTVQYEVVQMP